MEIRIGVTHSSRELPLETDMSAADLTALVETAINESPLLTVTDTKGRTVLVPGARINYVEYSTEEPRRVGFLG